MLTIPFAPALLASLRLARLLRVPRLLRLAALGSRTIAAERVLTIRRGFRYLALLTVLPVVLAGVAASVADAEGISSPWTGAWWAVTTVTTVGYGDIVPHTASAESSPPCSCWLELVVEAGRIATSEESAVRRLYDDEHALTV